MKAWCFKCIAAICLFPLLATSQDYPVKFLGIENGLSNNAVMSLYQDHEGFIWFGTYDGLNRYDGYSFKTFHNIIGDTNSLPGNTVFALEGDAYNQIWIGGQKGASVYAPLTSSFRKLSFKPVERDIMLPATSQVAQIKKLPEGQMLVGTQKTGLLMFDPGSTAGNQIVLEEGAVQNYDISSIEASDSKEYVWVFVQRRGLFKFYPATKRLVLFSNIITQSHSLKFMPGVGLWVGTSNGLYLFNPDEDSISENYLPVTTAVVNIMADSNNTLWIATDGAGIFLVNEPFKTARHETEVFGSSVVKSNSVWRIFEDRERRKWIGTLRGGISVIAPDKNFFKHITYKSSRNTSADNFILSFCEDQKQQLWIGTDGAGLRRWDRASNQFKEYWHSNDPQSISSNFVTSIIKDVNNNMWVSTWFGGVNKFDSTTEKFTRYNCYNPTTASVEQRVWLLYEDAHKELWASTSNTGSLYRYNKHADQFELFDKAITDLQVLTETPSGEFWGGNYNTLIKIDRQHKQHQIYPIGYTIRSIFEDKDKQLWVGTQEGGLLLFDRHTGQYKRYTVADGLPGNTILRILQDDKGYLWLSSYNGLCRFDIEKAHFRKFSISDGLQSNQFSFNAGLSLSTGEFVFGGINGFNIFSPGDIKNEANNIPVFLNGITVSNTPMKGNSEYVAFVADNAIKSIQLPYEKAVVSLDYLALSYAGADKINYAYKLEGWDKEWIYTQNNRRANYSRLNEGSYNFLVKVAGPDGLWGPDIRLLDIKVMPPWYRTWWSYFSLFLLVAGSIFIYNRYTRKQERLKYEVKLVTLEREKDKELSEKQMSIFTNMSHEFRTHLSLIISPLKKLVSGNSVAESKDLDTAYRNSRRLLSLVDQLLLFKKAENKSDTLKVSAINITALCQEVFACFGQLASGKGLRYDFHHPAEDIVVYGDREKIEIALFNIVSNAFKFTTRGAINLHLSEQENSVQIRVADTGIGIAGKDIERIFGKFEQGSSDNKSSGFGVGLYLVHHFISLHKGNIHCNSIPGEGTTMSIDLLKGKSHFPENTIWQELPASVTLLEELAVFESVGDNSNEQTAPNTEELLTNRSKILVVDDNPEMRTYLSRLFDIHYIVYTANNGISGLKAAEKHLPDIIISDVNMDGMDGLALCLQVKKSEQLGHIPVILLTAVDAAEVKLKGVASGADDYITKPFDDDLLLTRIDVTLKSRNQLRKYFLDNITLQHNTLKVPAEYRNFLQQCIQVIESNLDNEDFNIKYFARQMGMSHSALYSKVKAISGQSLNAFIRSIRIRRAAVLMLTEEMNISQAAFQVGLGDVKYFRQQFVKLFGVTPSEYIKKYKHSFNAELNIIKIKE